MNNPWTLDRIFRLFLLLVLASAGLWLGNKLSDALIPFSVAFLLAYAINPIVVKIQKFIPSRSVAVIITLFLITLISIIALALLIAPVSMQLANAGKLISRAVNDPNFTSQIVSHIPPSIWDFIRVQLNQEHLKSLMQDQQILQWAATILTKIAPGAFSIVSGAWSVVIGFFGVTVVLIYLFFMLLEYSRLNSDLINLIPPHIRNNVLSFINEADKTMSTYFRAQAVVTIFLTIYYAIAFSAINLPLGIVFGIVVGLMTLIPYMQLASIPFAALLVLLQSIDAGQAFWINALLVTGVYLFGQVLQDLVLIPHFIGDASGLSPVMIMLSLSIWGQLWGFFGLIIAIPFTCLVLAYYRKLLRRQQENPKIPSAIDSAEL